MHERSFLPRSAARTAVGCAAFLLAACSTNPGLQNASGGVAGASGDVAKTAASVIGAPLIPDANVQLGPTTSYPLEKLVYWGAAAALAYYVLDPLAPNWEIEEARFPQDHVHLSLKMKRYYAGGAGEARLVFERRAKALMRAGGFSAYEIVEYAEALESSLLGSQRKAEGVIRLIKQPG